MAEPRKNAPPAETVEPGVYAAYGSCSFVVLKLSASGQVCMCLATLWLRHDGGATSLQCLS